MIRNLFRKPKYAQVRPAPTVDLSELSVFRAESFPNASNGPWLDAPDANEQIDSKLANGTISAQEAQWCHKWVTDGYIVIERMFDPESLARTWSDYEELIARGVLKPEEDHDIRVQNPLPGRTLNPHFHSRAFKTMLEDERAVELVSLLFGAQALPFQTIAGHKGSEQLAHSDSIHMTTYPQGYLMANWVAFQDIHPDSGPLEFYPGSHKLPYVYAKDCGISLAEGRNGYTAYHAKYEPHVQEMIRSNALQPSYFHAKTGDVLFWHANLIHGGSRIRNAGSSRRALVCHYFAEGCVCYHDYTGDPSYLTKLPPMNRERFNVAAYLAVNPDVAAAGVDAYEHYINHGYAEGRRLK